MKSLVLFLEIYCISHVVMSVRLSPSGVYSVCPGEEVIYRCIIPGVSVLRWIIRPSPIEANVEFVFTSSMTELQMASISGVIFVARVDSTNPSFNSTLTTTASQSFVSDGIMIECTSGGVTNSSTLNINGHPETIQNLSSTEEYTSGYMYTNTIINWSSPDGVDTTFIVSIDPPLPSGSFFTTSGRSLQLMTPYNINYTISIVGSNCIGNSSTAELQIGYTQVLCPKLNISENATVLWNENRASTISGSNVTIQCLPGFAPTYKRTFTCDTNGMWKPDLEMFKCYVNCGQPTPPNNVHLEMPNGTTEGSWILIKCNNGNNTTSAVCDSDGRWLPDPSQHYSNCESSTRVTVKGTMTSESTVLYASIPLVLVVIICSVLLLIIIMCIKSNKGKSSRDSSNTRADDHELQSEVIVNEPRVNVEPEYEEVVVVKEPQVNEELEKNVAYKGHNDIKVRENVAYERKDNIKPVENVAAAYKWHNDIKVRENVVYGINNNQLKLVENVAYDGQVHLELIKNAAYGTL